MKPQPWSPLAYPGSPVTAFNLNNKERPPGWLPQARHCVEANRRNTTSSQRVFIKAVGQYLSKQQATSWLVDKSTGEILNPVEDHAMLSMRANWDRMKRATS